MQFNELETAFLTLADVLSDVSHHLFNLFQLDYKLSGSKSLIYEASREVKTVSDEGRL